MRRNAILVEECQPRFAGQTRLGTVASVPSSKVDLRPLVALLATLLSHAVAIAMLEPLPKRGGFGSFIIDRFTVNSSLSFIQS